MCSFFCCFALLITNIHAAPGTTKKKKKEPQVRLRWENRLGRQVAAAIYNKYLPQRNAECWQWAEGGVAEAGAGARARVLARIVKRQLQLQQQQQQRQRRQRQQLILVASKGCSRPTCCGNRERENEREREQKRDRQASMKRSREERQSERPQLVANNIREGNKRNKNPFYNNLLLLAARRRNLPQTLAASQQPAASSKQMRPETGLAFWLARHSN